MVNDLSHDFFDIWFWCFWFFRSGRFGRSDIIGRFLINWSRLLIGWWCGLCNGHGLGGLDCYWLNWDWCSRLGRYGSRYWGGNGLLWYDRLWNYIWWNLKFLSCIWKLNTILYLVQ